MNSTEVTIFYFIGALIGIFIVALIFRWTLSIGRQIRQNDRLFELMARMAEQQGITREELNWIYKRHTTPSSSTDIQPYQSTLKKQTA